MAAQPTQYTGTESPYDMSPFGDFQLDGDFYRESDEITRGVTLPPNFSEEDLYTDLGQDAFSLHEVDAVGKAESLQENIFSDLFQPPWLPAISATSLALRADSSPGAVAQSLHDFLAQESGDIVKVNARKFAVKADIFQMVNGSLLNCRIKARVYRSSEAFVVDFCRRSGDAVAFQQTFTRAMQHLLANFKAVAADTEKALLWYSTEPSSDPCMAIDSLEEAALDPLLDMLRDTSPTQQAEALAALVTMAVASTAGSIAVCAALGREADILKACTSSCRAEVSYPASQLEAVLHERCSQVGVC